MATIWVLGAAGRVGRAVVQRLQGTDVEMVLAGRSRERLAAVAPDTAARCATAGSSRLAPAGRSSD